MPKIHDPESVTARFTQQPTQHNGSSPFKLRFEFSHSPAGLSYKTVRDQMFDVTGGTINKARRLSPPSNLGWELRIVPTGSGEVTLSARATTDCTAPYAACDADGRKFAGALNTTIAGPPSTNPQ
ncbi:MAG: hypothetical protein KTU85_08100 [Acidimicrobiia bacterium]|nr:hypothetical protein [Acidimicrobiia bacterium]MCY4458252.1 hypothetical protein [Acidimicrobiaceae bacterium]